MSVLSFRLIVVTDADAAAKARRTVLETVRLVCEGSPKNTRSDLAFLLRDKNATKAEVRSLATRIHEVTSESGVPLLVHSHWDVARDLNLAGAHLTAHDDVRSARAGLHPHQLLGASRHAGDVIDSSLDYAFLSPVFRPTSKPDDDRPPLLPDGLARCVIDAGAPVFALGGIQRDNAARAIAAGATGVAVLGAVMAAPDPRDVVRTIQMVLARAATRCR